jgi:hypothetical protein
MAKKNNSGLVIGGLLLGGGLIWWLTSRPAAAATSTVTSSGAGPGLSNPQIQYLLTWTANHNDQNWINAVGQMTPQEQTIMGALLQQYWTPNNGLTAMPPADGQAWAAITSKYNIS